MESNYELNEGRESQCVRVLEREARTSVISAKVVEAPQSGGVKRKRSFVVTEESRGRCVTRRSFRAIESEDVVPGTSLRDSPENIQTESTETFSDSLTPDFPSIIVIIDSNNEDITISDAKNKHARYSKRFYEKPNMELKIIADTETTTIVSENIYDSVEIKPNALEKALDILKKFNFEKCAMQNYIDYQNATSFSYESQDLYIDRRRETLSDSRMNESDEYQEFKNLEKRNDSLNIPQTFNTQESYENQTSFKISTTLRFNISNDIDEINLIKGSYTNVNKMTNQSIKKVDYVITDDNGKDAINDVIQVRTLLLDEIFYRTNNFEIILNKTNEKISLSQIEESKEKLVNKIMANTIIKENTSTNMRRRKKSYCIKNKEMSFKFKKNRENIPSSKPFHNLASILCNPTKPVSTYRVPWEKLVLNGDVIILRNGVIVNINDIVDSIGCTVILRDLGLLMLPDGVLITKAIKIVKLKSETLKILIRNKFPILQDYNMVAFENTNQNLIKVLNLKNSINLKSTSKSKRKLNVFNIVLSINGLLKSSSTFPRSTKWHKKRSYMKEMIWKFRSQSIYNETIKNNLDSLKKCLEVHMAV